MAPQPYPTSLASQAERQPAPPFTNTSLQSPSSQTITNIVFGLCALLIGLVTFWQGRRAWIMWHPSRHASHQSASAPEVELGQRHVGSVEDSESNQESPSSRTHDGELSVTPPPLPPPPPPAVVIMEEVGDTSFQASNSSSREASESLKCGSDNERTLSGENNEPGADTSDVVPTLRAENAELAADTNGVAPTARGENEEAGKDTSNADRSST